MWLKTKYHHEFILTISDEAGASYKCKNCLIHGEIWYHKGKNNFFIRSDYDLSCEEEIIKNIIE